MRMRGLMLAVAIGLAFWAVVAFVVYLFVNW